MNEVGEEYCNHNVQDSDDADLNIFKEEIIDDNNKKLGQKSILNLKKKK